MTKKTNFKKRIESKFYKTRTGIVFISDQLNKI